MTGPTIVTARLVLRPFTEVDLTPFFELNTHPLVVESLGSSPTQAESDGMVDRFKSEMEREGWGLWAVDVVDGDSRGVFAGMVGLHRVNPNLPCAPAVEAAWRFHPDHWGHGYAGEAARASLEYGFDRGGLDEIVAFTTTLNVRSQAVMERIGMWRDVEGDFDHPGVPADSPLRRHVLYRISASHDTRSVAP